jgi:hypothetical protein
VTVYAGSLDAHHIGLNYSYDENALEFVSATCTGGIADNKRIVAADINNILNGSIATVTFKVKDNAADGTYTLNLSLIEAYDNEPDDTPVKLAADSISVMSKYPGDLNNDGKVNGKDNVLLMQYLAGWDVTINMTNADINGDGSVNGKDNVLLMQYLAGWSSNYIK